MTKLLAKLASSPGSARCRCVRDLALAWCVSLSLLISMPLRCELSVRECHLFTESRSELKRTRDVLRIEPATDFQTIGTLTADFGGSSDQVVHAAVWLAPGNSPGALLELEVRAGDRSGARSFRRVPGDSPHTVMLRSFFPDIEPGSVTYSIAGRNLSEGPVDIFGFWISPLLLPASMQTRTDEQWSSISIGESWTTLATSNFVDGASQVLASGEISLLQGQPGTMMSYRIVGGREQAQQSAWVPDFFPESHGIALFSKPSAEDSTSVSLQARATAPATIGQRRLTLQQVPDLPVLRGSLPGPVVVPNDGLRYRLARSGTQLLEERARGTCGRPGSECDGRHTHGWGWSNLLVEGSGLTESMAMLRLVDSSEQALWCPPGCGDPPCEPHCRPGDIGIASVATSGGGRIGGGPSAWLHVGFSKQDPIEALLEIHGSCPSASRGISVLEAQFELLVLPDNEVPGHRQECSWNLDLLVRDVAGAQRQCFESVHGVGR